MCLCPDSGGDMDSQVHSLNILRNSLVIPSDRSMGQDGYISMYLRVDFMAISTPEALSHGMFPAKAQFFN